jgi:hypothetical protein
MSSVGPLSSAVESVSRRSRGLLLRSGVRRFIAASAAGIVLLALAATPAALGAGQQHNRFHDVGTDVDPDFCGTGQAIEIAFDARGNEFEAPHKADFKLTLTGTSTFTNPATGDVVILRSAGPIWDTLISGDPEGIHVIESTVKGLPELIKTPHGGVLTRDAGYLVVRNTFDGDELISSEIVLAKGPHPDKESDLELFCELVPEALGIT